MSKPSALESIYDQALKVTPVLATKLYINEPTISILQSLNNDNGILVWLDHQPYPLRIVIEKDELKRIWGAEFSCVSSQEKSNLACEEVRRLDSLFSVGMKRSEIYSAIISFDTKFVITVGNFLVGVQRGSAKGNYSEDEYYALLMSADAWKFDGLRDLLLFEHFYSDVTRYFDEDRLSRIEHWRFLFETP
jgi:hypothetical protein